MSSFSLRQVIFRAGGVLMVTVVAQARFELYVGNDSPWANPPLVTISPPINPQGASTGYYPSNSVVTLTARDADGWTFQRWYRDVESTNHVLNVVMDSNKAIEYDYATRLSIAAPTNEGRIEVTTETPRYRERVVAVAIPNAGYYFTGWNGIATGSTNPAVFDVTGPNPSIRANFATLGAGQVSLAVKHAGDTEGTVLVSPRKNVYAQGEHVRVEVDLFQGTGYYEYARAPMRFVGWRADASGTDNPLDVRMDRSKVIEAVFEPAPRIRYMALGTLSTTFPAVAEDGTLYVISEGALFSFTPDLRTNWVVAVTDVGAGNPAIGDSGNIYAASPNGNAVCVSPAGRVLWKYVSGDPEPASAHNWPGRVALTADETLYFGSAGTPNVHVVKDGELVRKLPDLTAGPIREQVPVLGPDETLYFPTESGFAAHQPFGTVKWEARSMMLPSAIDVNGRLYSVAGSNIVALNFSGQELWRTGVAGTPESVLIGEGGRVFVKSEAGLTALSTNGVVLWKNSGVGQFTPLSDGGAMLVDEVIRPQPMFPPLYITMYVNWLSVQHLSPNGKVSDFATYLISSFPMRQVHVAGWPIITDSGDTYMKSPLTVMLTHRKEKFTLARSSWATPFGARNTGRAITPVSGPRLAVIRNGSGWILRKRGTEEVTLESSTNLLDWVEMGEIETEVSIEAGTGTRRFYRSRVK